MKNHAYMHVCLFICLFSCLESLAVRKYFGCYSVTVLTKCVASPKMPPLDWNLKEPKPIVELHSF